MLKATLVLCLSLCFLIGKTQVGNEEELIKESNSLFEQHNYAAAYPLFAQLLSIHPNNADYHYHYGVCAIFEGANRKTAIKHLELAEKSGRAAVEVYYYLGRAYHLNYQFMEALASYRKFQEKADVKLLQTFDVDRQITMCKDGQALLSDVKDLIVLEKTEVEANSFFRYYNLEDIGGKILMAPQPLRSKIDEKLGHESVMHYDGASGIIYYSSYGKDGKQGKDLYKAYLLPDGNVGNAQLLSGEINTPYDEDFPFMHPDGKTFYFSSKGHNSMGGYDIFKSEINPNTGVFGKPVNLDFAINTPNDDLFYVADALNEKAYFASGRMSDFGMLHVYKVMVKRIPMQFVFIQGNFINELAGGSPVAEITLKDALTGKSLPPIHTNPVNGDYLISLPKPGVYQLEVKASGSQYMHEATLDVPIAANSAAYAQKIRLEETGGFEKLIVDNFFDQPLDVDLSALSRELLLEKEKLDVNVTDELLAEMKEEAPDNLSIERDVNLAPMAAGFSEEISLNQIQEHIDQENKLLKANIKENNEKRNAALLTAKEQQNKSKSLMNEAQQLMDTSDKRDSHFKEKQYKIAALLTEAEQYNRASQSATNLATDLSEYNSEQSAWLLYNQALADSIKSASESNDFEALVSLLKSEKKRESSKEERLAQAPSAILAMEAEKEQKGLNKCLSEIELAREEQGEIRRKLAHAEQALTLSSKKKDQALIQTEIDDYKGQLAATESQISGLVKKAEDLAEVENLTRMELALLKGMEAEGSSFTEAALQMADSELDQKKLEEVQQKEAVLIENKKKEHADYYLAATGEYIPQYAQPSRIASIAPVGVSPNADGSALAQIPSGSGDPKVDEYRNALLAAQQSQKRADQKTSLLVQQSATSDPEKKKELEEALNELAIKEESLASIKTETPVQNPLSKPVVLEPESAINFAIQNNLLNPGELELLEGGNVAYVNASRQLYVEAIEKIDLQEKDIEGSLIEASDMEKFGQLSAQQDSLKAVRQYLTQSLFSIDELEKAYQQDLIYLENDRLQGKDVQLAQENLDASYLSGLQSTMMVAQSSEGLDEAISQEELNALSDKIHSEEKRIQANQTTKEGLVVAKPESSESSLKTEANINGPEDAYIPLPDQSAALIKAIMPDYMSERAALIRNSDEAGLEALDRQLYDRVQAEINAKKTLPANEADKALIVQDILRLELIASGLVEAEGLSMTEDPSKDVALLPQFETDAEKQLFITDLKSPPVLIDPKEDFSILIADLEKQHGFTIDVIENEEEIKAFEAEVVRLESEMKQAADEKTLKKLDKELEKAYFNLAKVEIPHAQKYGRFLDHVLYTQGIKLDSLEQLHSDKAAQSAELDSLLHLAKSCAAEALDEARGLRATAPMEMDEIKQNYMFRQALSLELDALHYMEKNFARYENIDLLIEAERQEALKKAQSQQQIEALALAQKPAVDLSDEAKEGSNVKEEVSVIVADEQPELPTEKMAPLAEVALLKGVLENEGQLQNSLVTTHGLTEGQIALMLSEPDVVLYQQKQNALSLREAGRIEMVKSRNNITAEYNQINLQLLLLEQSVAVAESEAEKEGLQLEVKRLRAKAEVNYHRIEDLDQVIQSEEEAIEKALMELSKEYEAMDIEGRAEAMKMKAPAAISQPEYLSAADYRGFKYPVKLESDIFSGNIKGVYSKRNPIPVNVDLPEGLIYKVQVGAFRNPLPPNHFEPFAPMCGESLNNGIIRYTAGLFTAFNTANSAKNSIRERGYSDAFVVAFWNGKRISLQQAREIEAEKSGSPLLAQTTPSQVEKKINEAPLSERTAASSVIKKPESTNTIAEKDPLALLPASTNAKRVEESDELFYTVQVGVYSSPVTMQELYNLKDVNSESLADGKIRYSAGRYSDLNEAKRAKENAVQLGVADAFVTAYQNGKRISVSSAQSANISTSAYRIQIGAYVNEVPSEVAVILLSLDAQFGVKQMQEGDTTYFYTRNLTDKTEAEKWLSDLKTMGLYDAKLSQVKP